MKGSKQYMAKKSKVVEKSKKKVGRPASNPEDAIAKKKGSPIVFHAPRKLKGMAKLAALAQGESLNTILVNFLKEWVPKQQKAIAKLVSDTANVEDDDEDETEENDKEEEKEDSDDDDEEEEDEDESEDEDDD